MHQNYQANNAEQLCICCRTTASVLRNYRAYAAELLCLCTRTTGPMLLNYLVYGQWYSTTGPTLPYFRAYAPQQTDQCCRTSLFTHQIYTGPMLQNYSTLLQNYWANTVELLGLYAQEQPSICCRTSLSVHQNYRAYAAALLACLCSFANAPELPGLCTRSTGPMY